MTNQQKLGNRITSVILTIAILFTLIPLTFLVTSAGDYSNRVADPSTMDAWKELFPISGEISTQNAGGVWMDKSVFTDANAFANLGISQDDPESFIVALSAMAANMSVTGTSGVPTDTMLILDVSGSMNDNSGNNDVAEELVDAANTSIATLLSSNKSSRVGVVLYSGSSNVSTNYTTAAMLLLPLARYTTGSDGKYLTYTVTGRDTTTETIGIDADVVFEANGQKPTSQTKDVVGATYIQRGIITAMNEFVAEDNVVVASEKRMPVVVLMSDGAPSLGSTNFTDPGYGQEDGFNMGTGSGTSAALGFVSQLTASYAKAKIEEKYGSNALFYTLGLGLGSNDTVALSVMDPDNVNGSTAVDDFWNDIQTNWRGRITFEGYNHIDVGETVSLGGNNYVTKIDTVLEQNYVDQYFAANTTNLVQVFQSIMSEIQLQSAYFPTLVSQNEDLSGYVSFVDRIGEYMSVTDIKGILIDNHLFSGADLSSNFVAGGGNLGTWDSPTALGIEMVSAVKERLGLASDEDARTLIGLAYENGQLSYTDKDNYSNYIGWYANQRGEFLGFYNEGTTILPSATGNADTDPAFIVRSYGYLGEVDESHGVTESDMMYATVQVRKNIVTGDEIVTFAIPAALIPVVTYEVALDKNGELSNLSVSGAENPIRLVYEVALDDEINAFNVKEIVSAEYLADPHNINADGSINFYTNQWDHENTTGYGTVNTYSYFNPSRQNDRYYYLEDTLVYSDTKGTLYTGEDQPDAEGDFYRSFKVYKNNGKLSTETVYRALSDAVKTTAVRNDDGSWYVPKDNVHVNLDGYTVTKQENKTATLTESFIPFVDTHNHSINDTGYNFFVGATLGNNGKLTLTPETGIKLTKALANGTPATEESFAFDIFNQSNNQDGNVYEALLVKADGTTVEAQVEFDNGKATFELKAGEALYIGGMAEGQTFRIVERETIGYLATASGLDKNGEVTVSANEMTNVNFVNEVRGEGDLAVAKIVRHDFGTDYNIPEDKVFTMQVDLDGIGTENAEFKAAHTNGAYETVTTDENGRFTVSLKHDEQFKVLGLPAGTVATVVEKDVAEGFTPAYYDNGVAGNGVVTVEKDTTVSVAVINDYFAKPVIPTNINLGGTKTVRDIDGNIIPATNWADNYSFDIVLERFDTENGWVRIGEKTVNKNNPDFSFNDVLSKQEYAVPGAYSYQLYEVEPEIGDADRVDGMIYDVTWHTFTVHVYDNDMDGQLEIVRVSSEHSNKDFEPENGIYNVETPINNTQTVTVPALAIIDYQKILENASESPIVTLAGYRFGIYTDASCTNAATTGNGIRTISINPTDAVGEGWIDIELDETGEYTFFVKEIAGQNNKMTYSEQVIKVVINVDVHPTNANALVADMTYYDENGDEYLLGNDGEIEFTNIYAPDSAELVIDFVNKELSGRELDNAEFDFAILDAEDKTILEGTNDKDGKVNFDGTLKFDKVGVYYYRVVETSEDENGVTTDKTVYHVTVTVTDNNGTLVADHAVINVTGDTITFKNTYKATPVDNAVEGSKTLRGRNLINDEFSFILTEMTVDGEAVSEPKNWTAKNFANGDIVFPTITYNEAGTYVYRIEEVVPELGKAYGITYDQTQYKVTVVIEDNGLGKLIVKSETVTLLNGTGANAISFVNEYEADPTWAQFTGNKQLTGKVNNALQGGEFEFVLYDSNDAWEELDERETVENGAGGLITFTKIDFETDEDQYFLVKEKNGGKTIDGITYDDNVYCVWVEVTDDLKGQLHATVHIYDGEGIPRETILFVNVYEITGGAEVELSGEKTIDGREWKEGDEFTFDLFETDEYFNYDIDNANSIVASDKVGFDDEDKEYLIKLEYDPEDVGKTFYYAIVEEGRGETVDGLTNSMAEYFIKVTVEDDNKGGIATTVTVENATTSTLNFVNTYSAEETEIVIDGNKELVGRDMEEGEFEFRMIEADENFKPLEGATAKIAFNEESGAFEFDAVTFRAVGKYYFVITEENTENDKRVTYDDTVYHVTVEVTDDLNGNLVANDPIVLKANETEPSNGINFVNIFTPKPDDVTVDIEIVKTVVNKGTAEIGPEGFEFILDDLADETDEMTAVTDEEGNAKFTLTFTEDDIGKTFNYKLTEIDGGKHGVEYSKAEYNIAIEITLDEETNTLAANIIQNDAETENVVAEFENIYEVDIPKPGDDTDLTLWTIMMLVSGAALTLFVRDKKRKTARDM